MPTNKVKQRLARKSRIRRHLAGNSERPRFSVFRSLKNISVQVIDDDSGETLVSVSSYENALKADIQAIRDNPPKPPAAEPEPEEGKKKKKKAKKKPEALLTVNLLIAEKIGQVATERCKAKDIEKVVFDRNGYKYHGRVKRLADAARKAGLDF